MLTTFCCGSREILSTSPIFEPRGWSIEKSKLVNDQPIE